MSSYQQFECQGQDEGAVRVTLGLIRTGACRARLWCISVRLCTYVHMHIHAHVHAHSSGSHGGGGDKQVDKQAHILPFSLVLGAEGSDRLVGRAAQAQVPTKTVAGYFWDK